MKPPAASPAMVGLRRRLELEEIRRDKLPAPDEIAERTEEIRRGWTDEKGVLRGPRPDDLLEEDD